MPISQGVDEAMIRLKTAEEIERIAAAGRIVAAVLQSVGALVQPGITTAELDQRAVEIMTTAGARSSSLGYGQPPFPASICTSVDEEVVHGIPSRRRTLSSGCIVSVDVALSLNGYHADATRTFPVGTIDERVRKLLRETETCFWKAYNLAQIGARLGDLSAAIQQHAESCRYGVVRELTGHGIGRELHEPPDLPNFGKAGHGPRLEAGLVLAMEPMINLGERQVRMLEDSWTIVTADGLPSAHYENTIAITEEGPKVLTLLDGENVPPWVYRDSSAR